MCTVAGLVVAGIPVDDRAVLRLAASLREAEPVDTAEILEGALRQRARIVALEMPDREAILSDDRRLPRGLSARVAGSGRRGELFWRPRATGLQTPC